MAMMSEAIRVKETPAPYHREESHQARKMVRETMKKMTPEDDVEAFLIVFERIAEHERLPAEQWAEVLAPLLSGEPQKAYYDLALQDARNYAVLKAEILARLGVTVTVRAQRVHQWEFKRNKPTRSQMFDLLHLVQKWLQPDVCSPEKMVERVVMDRFMHALSKPVQCWVAQGNPQTTDDLVGLVERYCTVENTIAGPGPLTPAYWSTQSGAERPQRGLKPHLERRFKARSIPEPTPRPSLKEIVCWRCHGPGHMAAQCPLSSDPMDCSLGRRTSMFAQAACTAVLNFEEGLPFFPVCVNGTPITGLLDSGSLVTLLTAQIPHSVIPGKTLGVTCIHGDTKTYPIAQVTIKADEYMVSHQVGVVQGMKYEMIIGRDCPLFWDLWAKAVPQQCPTGKDNPVPIEPEFPLSVLVGDDEEESATEETIPDLDVSRGNFGTAQLQDETIKGALNNLSVVNGAPQESGADERYPHFAMNGNLLYRVTKIREELVEQLVVPKPYRRMVLDLAHKHVLGGHLGGDKTLERVLQRFYWPGCYREIRDYCQSCPECQITSPVAHFRSPLIPLPIIEVPFERIAMDLVGPLVKSARGHQYILVIVDYATRYPEAIPLRKAAAKPIARELFHVFSRTGLPKEILTDQGTPFMSKVMRELCKVLNITQLRTSVYHPQTDGLVERFNKTLKGMLKKVVEKDGRDWDYLLPYLLFAIREVPQASTGFSPFELLYGRHPRGLLDIAKETWESEVTPYRSVIEHVTKLQERITQVMPIVKEHLQQAQEAQARIYNRSARLRQFSPGDRVLVLIPTVESKFLAKWQGPYEVVERVSEVNYRVHQPGRRKPYQIYHINLLKPWKDRDVSEAPCLMTQPSTTVENVKIAETLSPSQKYQCKVLLQQNRDLFTETPGLTNVVEHEVFTEPQTRVNLKPYRIPEARREIVSKEVQKMLKMGVIEESKSGWSSPIVLVPKPNGEWRFCNDYRKLNEVSKVDAYPMPRVDELIERLGPARYMTTLDLTKGYWQIPLSKEAKEKTAFSTPEGSFQYVRMPFGLQGAPATFQRAMDQILRPHREYAAAYLDDIVIFSHDWESHLSKVQTVLDAIRKAGFTINPSKCAVGLEEARYLGYIVGRGEIKPQVNKVEAIQEWPRPLTKKQVKAFLGIVGYYRRFVPKFADIAVPLIELTKGAKSTMIKWSPEAEEAFQKLKSALCRQPVLVAPDFSREFVVQTDASEVGLGAVMSQVINGEEHPVCYLSRKLSLAERNYAIIEKECLAIKWALEYLRYYLIGRKFRLISDHAPLKWLREKKGNNARVNRWFLALQDFNFSVEHRPGKLQGNADALSRVHCMSAEVAQSPGFGQRGGICRKAQGTVVDGRYVSPRYLASVK